MNEMMIGERREKETDRQYSREREREPVKKGVCAAQKKN